MLYSIEASDLINNQCPICHESQLKVEKEIRDPNENELLYTDCKCNNCNSKVRVFND